MNEASIISRLRSALNHRFDTVAKEPLPKKWIDLIKELHKRERAEAEVRKCAKPETRPH